MGQQVRLDVAVDEGFGLEFQQQAQARNRKGDVQPHPQCRTAQHQSANVWGVVVNPGCRQHAADAVREYGDILNRDTVVPGNVADERIYVPHQHAEIFGITTLAGAAAMTTGIPGEQGKIGQVELIHCILPAAGMFMAAMKQDHCPVNFAVRQPRPVK